jgi:hypothetical protein
MMKTLRTTLRWLVVGLGLLASGSALAQHRFHHGGHGGFHGPRVGVFIGAPLFWPYYGGPYYGGPYYAPYAYYPPPVIAVPAAPPVYVEQGPGQAAPAQPAPWYYCADPSGYYPYVTQCPGGWQQVAPQPPA